MRIIFLLALLPTCLFLSSQTNSGLLIKATIKQDSFQSDSYNFINKFSDNKQLFVYGAISDTITYKVGLQIFNNLVRSKNVRVLLIERPEAYAYKINEYLKTNNLDDFISAMDEYMNCKSCKAAEKYFLKNLSIIYRALPDSQKFTVRGIDYDFKRQGVELFYNLMPYNYNSSEKDLNRICLDSAGISPLRVLSHIEKNQDYFSKLYGSNYMRMKYLLKNLTYESRGGKYFGSTYPERETIKYNNTIDLFKESNSKMFAIVSFEHLPKSYIDEWVWDSKNIFSFIAMLNKYDNSILKNKVCSILPLMCVPRMYYHNKTNTIIDYPD